ncbi:hypothetical protein N7G274_010017 [Stereocaulon virgatum]|uniref:Uncharacterized protein n=1 Tax=Stereocaulon virgatum TaxID=373712 RepID=A0ABR4A1Y1_9LECA
MSRPTTPIPSNSAVPGSFTSLGPSRSSTHPVKPRHHIPHHPHRTHHHRHHDVPVPQTAILPTTSNPFGELLAKTTTKNIDGAKTPAQEQQQQRAQEEQAREQSVSEEAEKRKREEEVWKEVERKRRKRKAADEFLLTTLTSLSNQSTTITRRLDYTYYSLLTSLSSLTSTLSELHKLSSSTTHLSHNFASESTSLASDISSQINSTATNFDAQADRIRDLENRIKKARLKANDLGMRLDAARTKVEDSKRRDEEGERTIGRRLRVLWGCCGVWIVLFMILIIVRQRGPGVIVSSGKIHEAWGLEGRGNISQDTGLGSAGIGRSGSSSSKVKSSTKRKSAVDAEATLRLFDEL